MRAIQCAKCVPNQVARFLNLDRSVRLLKTHVYPESFWHVKDFFDKYDNSCRLRGCVKVLEDIFFGEQFILDENARQKCNYSLSAKAYKKMLKYRCIYSGVENLRSCNNYAILNNNSIIKIHYFIHDIEQKKQTCLHSPVNFFDHDLSKYLFIKDEDNNEVFEIDVKEIKKICVFMDFGELRYIRPCANLLTY